MIESIPKNLFKSITFDCGKKILIGKPSVIKMMWLSILLIQERHLNGLLRRDGLPKEMDFNQVNQFFVSSVASRRNQTPRKYLQYQTPLEVFLSYINEWELSNLI